MKKPSLKKYQPVPVPVAIGEHIRKKRIECGLLQSDVAIQLDTCEDTITGWESGRSVPQISFYPKIIAFLGYYPFNHPTDSAQGLIERVRHVLGVSYEKLGNMIGAHGTTLMHWKRMNLIANEACETQLRQLLETTQRLPE